MKSFKYLLSEYFLHEYARQEESVKTAERDIKFCDYDSYDILLYMLMDILMM